MFLAEDSVYPRFTAFLPVPTLFKEQICGSRTTFRNISTFVKSYQPILILIIIYAPLRPMTKAELQTFVS